MTKETLLERLAMCADDSNTESAHADADDLLLEFINDAEIAEAYGKIDKWYA